MIKSNERILVTGATGFLGTHVLKELTKQGYSNVYAPAEQDIDLLSLADCHQALQGIESVINIAGKVGGTLDNKENPADFFYANALTGANLLHAARHSNLRKFVQLGSIISYPSNPVTFPVTEDELWAGYPDETKEGYAMAKKFLLVMGSTYRKQYNVPVVHLLLANMYGPNDHFLSKQAHVVPALVNRFWEAKTQQVDEVVVWGSGKATRDFLYVSDAARAIVEALDRYDSPDPVNIASGAEVSIQHVAQSIAKHIEYQGTIVWDKSKPDGQLRSFYDVSRATQKFGFKATTAFDEGMCLTVEWYQKNVVPIKKKEQQLPA